MRLPRCSGAVPREGDKGGEEHDEDDDGAEENEGELGAMTQGGYDGQPFLLKGPGEGVGVEGTLGTVVLGVVVVVVVVVELPESSSFHPSGGGGRGGTSSLPA